MRYSCLSSLYIILRQRCSLLCISERSTAAVGERLEERYRIVQYRRTSTSIVANMAPIASTSTGGGNGAGGRQARGE